MHRRSKSEVDGGVGRACRGDLPGDNSDDYYVVVSSQTLEETQGLGLGFRVWGLGFRVWGLRRRVGLGA